MLCGVNFSLYINIKSIVFKKKISIFVHPKCLNPAFKTGFSISNDYLNLYGQEENYINEY